MSDLNVALILRLVDKATAPARTALRAIERMAGTDLQRHVTRVTQGTSMMRDGIGGVGRAAATSGALLFAYGAGVTALAGSFIAPAAQMERFKVQLTNLEGSAAGADKALAWIDDFATRTPLQLEDTVAAYARLKAFGVDPTNGSLQALVDTMAATGGGAEKLDGLVMALGQAWTKGKLQSEEALQMLERGVPVWDLLAAKLGKTSAEVQEMATKGKLGREEITLLVEALAEANAGASEGMSKTWDGILSNVADHWGRFQRLVMGSGVFDYLKARLQALLDLLNEMAADGRLQQWADQVAKSILTGLEAMWRFGGDMVDVWRAVYPGSTARSGRWAAGAIWRSLWRALP